LDKIPENVSEDIQEQADDAIANPTAMARAE
jgi:hypothetical protein